MSSGTSSASASRKVRMTRPMSVSNRNDCIALFRRLSQLRGSACGHGWAGTTDRIGLVVVGNGGFERRVTQRGWITGRATLIRAAEAGQETDTAKCRVHVFHPGTQLFYRIVR